MRIFRWIGAKLHLLPNGELLRKERAEFARLRNEEQQKRSARIEAANELAEKIKTGEEDAPLTMEAFLRAAGVNSEQRAGMTNRGRRYDDAEY